MEESVVSFKGDYCFCGNGSIGDVALFVHKVPAKVLKPVNASCGGKSAIGLVKSYLDGVKGVAAVAVEAYIKCD